jgi:hypothetical protein
LSHHYTDKETAQKIDENDSTWEHKKIIGSH